MSDLELFKGNALVNSDLFKSLQDTNDNLAGGSGGGMRRISIKGSRFREIVGGEQVNVNSSGSLNVVILKAASLSRTYYQGIYNPENPTPPHCWSADNQVPSPDVPDEQRMASRCMDCPMNVKGSGQGESRACRYNQRLAVAIEGSYDKVYQLQLAATSIFGEAKDGKMPMQAYARYLKANNNTPVVAIVTQMYFDENAETPKLFFKPVRPLEEDELKQVIELREHADVERAITMSVVQVDKSGDKPAPAPKQSNNVLDKAPEEEPEEKAEVEEPKKVAPKKAAPEESTPNDLSALVDQWDDD